MNTNVAARNQSRFNSVFILVGNDESFGLECTSLILEKKINIVAIAGTSAINIANKLDLYSKNPEIHISDLEKPWNDAEFQRLTLDTKLLGLSLGLDAIVPNDFLASRFIINTHPSALPMNRGSHQSFWAIMDETLGGGSLHLMTSGVDEGPILFQETFALPPEITSRELQVLQLKTCSNLLSSRIQDIMNGNFNLMAQEAGTSHKKNQIKSFTTLSSESTIKVSHLLKLARATCNKNNGFWIETEEGSFQIVVSDVNYFERQPVKEENN